MDTCMCVHVHVCIYVDIGIDIGSLVYLLMWLLLLHIYILYFIGLGRLCMLMEIETAIGFWFALSTRGKSSGHKLLEL